MDPTRNTYTKTNYKNESQTDRGGSGKLACARNEVEVEGRRKEAVLAVQRAAAVSNVNGWRSGTFQAEIAQRQRRGEEEETRETQPRSKHS